MNDKPKLDLVGMEAQRVAKLRADSKYLDEIYLGASPDEQNDPSKLSELIKLVYQNAFLDGFNFKNDLVNSKF